MPARTLIQLPRQSRFFNRMLTLKAKEDLTETADATAQLFTISIPSNSRIRDGQIWVPRLFRHTADAAFDDVQVTVSDGSATFVANQQVAALAASPVQVTQFNRYQNLVFTSADGVAAAAADLAALKAEAEKIGDDVRLLRTVPPVGRIYLVPSVLTVTVTPKTGKNLAALNVGELRLYLGLIVPEELG